MPRLRKGDIASGVRRKALESERSVRNVAALLLDIKQGNIAAVDWIDIFSSYKRISSADIEELGIRPVSENTLKKYLAMHYPGGLSRFNADRSRIADHSPAIGSARTKDGLKEQLNRARSEVQSLVDEILEFSEQYLDLLEKAGDMAATHDFLQSELASHLRKFPSRRGALRIVRGREDEPD